MTLPVDVGMIEKDFTPFGVLDHEDDLYAVAEPNEPCVYVQIAERRSQLEDAETLRRVRAL